jgi:hypothetical protein
MQSAHAPDAQQIEARHELQTYKSLSLHTLLCPCLRNPLPAVSTAMGAYTTPRLQPK